MLSAAPAERRRIISAVLVSFSTDRTIYNIERIVLFLYSYRRGSMSRINSAVSQVAGKNIQTASPKAEALAEPTGGRKEIPKDEFMLSEGWPKQTVLRKAVIEELATLQKDFSKVHIVIGTGIDQDNLAATAAALGGGKHLIISSEWLEKMGADAQSLEKGKEILRQVLTQLSKDSEGLLAQGAYVGEDEVRMWAAKDPAYGQEEEDDPFAEEKRVIEQMKKMTEEMKAAKNKSRIRVSSSAFSVSGLYSKLAGASSKGQVQSAMGEARRSMGTLRMVASLGSQKEQAKARSAINSIQKLLVRGSRKIRRLNEEELTKIKKKKATEKKKAEKLKIELQKKRNARKIADRGIAMEGHLADVNHAFRFRNRDEEERYLNYSPYAAAADVSMPVDTIPAGAVGADIPGGIAAADITVSEAVTFDQIL